MTWPHSFTCSHAQQSVRFVLMSARESKSTHAMASFLARNPVFTHAEFVRSHTATGRSAHTSNTLLARHLAAGRLMRVQRGLYAVVPPGVPPDRATPDPYLVAAKQRPDAVIAYHTALAFHGKAYSTWNRFQYMTAARARRSTFRGYEFVPVQTPQQVRTLSDFGGGVLIRTHAGGELRVASLERTLVDILHAPVHGGGWEEIWRSFEMVEFFDLDAVIEHTLRLGTAVTAARVGFLLEQHREPWMVEERHLEALARHAPGQPRYLGARDEGGTLVGRWNLIVAESILDRSWEEPQ